MQYVLALLEEMLQGGQQGLQKGPLLSREPGRRSTCAAPADLSGRLSGLFLFDKAAQNSSPPLVQATLLFPVAADPERAALFHQRSDLQAQILTDPYTIFLR